MKYRYRLSLVAAIALLLFGASVLIADSDRSAQSPELASNQTATFAMYCYWTGEATLGRVEGVQASRIGHWAGREIVQVDFDPTKTDIDQLARALQRQGSFDAMVQGPGESVPASKAVSGKVIQASGTPHFIEPKHSLRTRHPKLWALGLDEAQAIALNSWSYFGGRMPDVLTDQQRRIAGN